MAKGKTLSVTSIARGWSFEVDGIGVVKIGLADIPDALHEQLALHGLKQKVSDALAQNKKGDGSEIPLADRFARMEGVALALMAGEWASRSEGEGPLVLRALAIVKPSASRESLVAFIEKHGAKNVAKLPAVKEAMDRLRGPAPDIDMSELDE